VCVVFGLLTATDPVAAAENGAPVSRYPTSEEALYVLACVERNGQNAEGLQKCSCAINAIEAQLSYEDYSQAVLVIAMRQAGGERAALYRDTIPMREIADRFIRAQTRANRQCFGRENPSTR
ncbi:MAG: hypothetical protein J2P55_16570, partial [Rhizobiales bacterium]|nr:hypothetical protein [Hyphomicrobiales bacterium]